MMTEKLHVYLHKTFVGVLEQNTHDGGALSFAYDANYIASKNPAPLSVSLPITSQRFDDKAVKPFFCGLLPDNEQLDLLARQLKTSAQNPFAILTKIGRDCAGAVEILKPSQRPIQYGEGKTMTLTPDGLCKILDELYANPLLAGGKRKMKLSLAGAQSKLAVFFDEKQDALPQLTDGLPSTHIIKPAMLHFVDSVYNEFFCMKLAKKMGLDVADVLLQQVQDKSYLLIQRYDRKKEHGLITRIHQEDFCQALAVMPHMKYQGSDGGPGIKQSMQLILDHSSQSAKDSLKFIHGVIFNYLIGNADAHGKNFSFLYLDDKIVLAPLYDLVSSAIYPTLDQNMAMKIGKVYDPDRLTLRHWYSLMPEAQSSRLAIDKFLDVYATKTPILAQELRDELEGHNIASPVFDAIIDVINRRADRIKGYFN